MRLNLTKEMCKKLLTMFVHHDLPSCTDEDRSNQYGDSQGWVQCTRCWLLSASEGEIPDGVEVDVYATIKLTKHKDSAELLGEYSDLINDLGAEHPRSINFMNAHKSNKEFCELARLANFLRQRIDSDH